MPAPIDAAERRQHVVEAAFRLVVAEGIDGASLRKVAAEAGLNIGSVRHFFNGHDDLLAAAAREAGERMGRRLLLHPAGKLHGLTGDEAVDALQALLEEVLPVDDERRAEATIVVELILASRTRAVFAPAAAQMAADLHSVVVEALTALGLSEPERAARHLTALIGGLTIDALTPHGSFSIAELRTTLRSFLQLLLPG